MNDPILELYLDLFFLLDLFEEASDQGVKLDTSRYHVQRCFWMIWKFIIVYIINIDRTYIVPEIQLVPNHICIWLNKNGLKQPSLIDNLEFQKLFTTIVLDQSRNL